VPRIGYGAISGGGPGSLVPGTGAARKEQAQRLLAREQELERQETVFNDLARQRQAEQIGYEQEIRRLKTRLNEPDAALAGGDRAAIGAPPAGPGRASSIVGGWRTRRRFRRRSVHALVNVGSAIVGGTVSAAASDQGRTEQESQHE